MYRYNDGECEKLNAAELHEGSVMRRVATNYRPDAGEASSANQVSPAEGSVRRVVTIHSFSLLTQTWSATFTSWDWGVRE